MEDPPMAFLELKGLVKRYGNFTAVEDCSLSVERGEFLCLLGPSGCGKTTTLQMVAGFIQPTIGRIVLDGHDITDLKPSKRGLGVVFQSYALFPHMTVQENVAFGLKMQKVPSNELTRRVSETLDLVHLQTFAQRYPSELSGGQKQRVAMARAIVIQPPVLLLDEPMGALDAKLREEMQIELRALQRRVGITTIMVTHDQAEAMTLADRVVLMDKGRIQQIARPYEMYEEPNGRFSSTFLGKANVFEGLRKDDGVVVQGVSLPCMGEVCQGEVDYIIRPEKVSFTGEYPLVKGTITTRIFLGNHWLFQVATPLGVMHITQVNTDFPSVSEGDTVGLTWSPGHARVLARNAV